MKGDKNEDKEENKEAPKPPDGGYGWFVVAASFLVNFFGDGVSYTFGTYLLKITDDLADGNKSTTAWIASLMAGVTYGCGPVSGVFINQFGCRITTIIGSILASFGFCISFFANSPTILYFTIGIIAGLGLGMMYLSSIVAVSMYFDKRLAFATGIAVCGSGVGTAAMSELAGFMINELEWRMCLVINGGILLSCIFCGLFFKRLKKGKAEKKKYIQESIIHLAGSLEHAPMNHGSGSLDIDTKELNETGNEREVSTLSSSSSTTTTSFVHQNQNPKPQKCSQKCCGVFRFLLQPVFFLFTVSNFFTNVGYNIPYTYLVDLATGSKENPIHEHSDAQRLITIIGVANIISRLGLGYISDFKCVNRLFLYNSALTICGLAVALAPVAVQSLPLLWVIAAVFGTSVGVFVNLSSVICVDLLGHENLVNGFSIILFAQGVGTVIGAPIAGLLFDIYQSHYAGFGLTGGLVSLSGLMLFIVPFLQRKTKSQKRQAAPKPAIDNNAENTEPEIQLIESSVSLKDQTF